MTYTSLTEIIDDILLLVRNNNISESEDLSRAQIEAWVNHYRHRIWKDRQDQLKSRLSTPPTVEELWALADDEFFKVKEDKLELEDIDETPHTKRSVVKLEGIFNDDWRSILAVHDAEGENIQYMNHIRRHYQYNRKYTFGELTSYYMNGYLYVQGLTDKNLLKSVYVLALYEMDGDDEGDDASDGAEGDIKIPSWMVPDIKTNILKNELAFMLNRPSDDDNNATLDGIKPHGPQDQEK